MQRIAPGRALDIGCGDGRNALYLNLKGFDVTAWDKNDASIASLSQLIAAEDLSGIRVGLKAYYQHWDVIKYNEDVGQLHKTDADGNRIQLRFATLLARKVA